MDYAALKAELALPAYAGLSDAEAAAALNAEIDGWRNVSMGEIAGHLELTGLFEEAQAAASSHADPAVKRIAAKLVRLCSAQSRVESIEMSDPAKRQVVRGMLAALVAGGVFTQAEADAVEALAKIRTTRAALLGLPVVRAAHVLEARAMQ